MRKGLVRQAQFLRRNRWEANRVFLLDPQKTILLNYTIIPTSIFSCLKRSTGMHELTKWWDEWFICSASYFIGMASPWHSGQKYKAHCSTQVLNNFSLGKVSSFPSSSVCSPELPLQTAAGSVPVLPGCSWEQFITSKSQLSTLEPSELFPPSHIIFENIIGGEERTSTLIAVISRRGKEYF